MRPDFKVIIKYLCLEKNISPIERAESMSKLKELFAGLRVDKLESFEVHNWSKEFASYPGGIRVSDHRSNFSCRSFSGR